MPRWAWITVVVVGGLLLLAALSKLSPRPAGEELRPYLYEDTRRLVLLVEDAARLVEERGQAAFREFALRDSRWLNQTYYLFVYDTDGVCVFHPVTPELVGRNQIGLKDINGKPVIELITAIGRRPERDAAGWVFYLWPDRTQLAPTWKSSYIHKAVAPDGATYCVGCGLSDMKIEKHFIQERVDRAADVLRAGGKQAALSNFLDPAGPFQFLGTFIFVMDEHGQSVIDPAFPTMTQRDLTKFQDAMGHYVIPEVLEKLEDADRAWVQYLRPKPGAILPSRKLLYVRKVEVGGETLIVGADFYLASPVWMKL